MNVNIGYCITVSCESNLIYCIHEKIFFCGEKSRKRLDYCREGERFANGERGGLGNARWQRMG